MSVAAEPRRMTRENRDLPKQVRVLASVRPDTINVEERTVEVVWTTGARVLREDWGDYYYEELSLNDGEVRLDRFSAGVVPLMGMHRERELFDQIGIVESHRWEGVGASRVGVAKVRFSRAERVAEIFQDVVDGIRRSVSIGYLVYIYRIIEQATDGLDVWRATDWEPYELSLVHAPADIGATTRGHAAPAAAATPSNPFVVAVQQRGAADEQKFPCVIERAATQENQMSNRSAGGEPGKQDPGTTGNDLVVAERERARGILAAGREAGAPDDAVTAAVEDGISVTEAKARFRAWQERKDADANADAVAKKERERVLAIQRAAGDLPHVKPEFVESLIAEGRSRPEALEALIAENKRGASGKRDKDVEGRETSEGQRIHGEHADIEITSEAGQKRYGAMQEYILHRSLPGRHPMTEGARQFRGMSMLDLCRAEVEFHGMRSWGSSRESVIVEALRPRSDQNRFVRGITKVKRAGYHVAGDFAELLGGTIERALLKGYGEYDDAWRKIVTPVTVNDLREKKLIRFGDAPDLLDIEEDGEYKFAALAESAEGISVAKAGRRIGVTLELIINDDLDAFGKIPLMFGRSASRKARKGLYALVNTGKTVTMSDTRAVFNTADGTLTTGAGHPPDLDGLQLVRKLMRNQPNLAGEPLGIVPRYLLIPDQYELAVDQLIGQDNKDRNPADPADRVPGYLKDMDYWVPTDLSDADGWGAFADPMEQESIGMATLSDQPEISVMQQEAWKTDGLEFKVRQWLGFAWIDRRGAQWVNNKA